MDRRSLLVACLLALAGCAVGYRGTGPPADAPTPTPSQTGDTPWGHGFLDARAVESAPTGATVLSATNASVADVDPFQRVVREAHADRQNRTSGPAGATVELTGREVDSLRERLPHEYRYDGDRFGWYVRYRGELYRVRLISYA